jgi:hypothetical protein
MAHQWTVDAGKGWVASTLRDDHRWLTDDGLRAVRLRRLANTPNGWTILTNDCAGVRVNGKPVPLGIAVLDDRDEIRMAGNTVWFSTETRPTVEPFPESTRRGSCPRCKQPLEHGTPAVRCPDCGVWHHASDEWPCWTYGTRCGVCTHPTALDGPWRFCPEDL